MRLRYERFEWDEGNRPKVERHGVTPPESEQIFRGRRLERRSRQGRRVAYGRTATGHYLFVVFQPTEGGGIRVITARPMTPREIHRYRRTSR